MQISYQSLISTIESQYKSLDKPNFSFVGRALKSKPYALLVEELSSIFAVDDVTDENDDVSFCYCLSNAADKWVVELSMIDSFAVLLRTPLSGTLSQVVEPDGAISPDEKLILSLLSKYHVSVLRQGTLEQRINLKLENTEPENVRIYQALFSDVDLLPWRSRI